MKASQESSQTLESSFQEGVKYFAGGRTIFWQHIHQVNSLEQPQNQKLYYTYYIYSSPEISTGHYCFFCFLVSWVVYQLVGVKASWSTVHFLCKSRGNAMWLCSHPLETSRWLPLSPNNENTFQHEPQAEPPSCSNINAAPGLPDHLERDCLGSFPSFTSQ